MGKVGKSPPTREELIDFVMTNSIKKLRWGRTRDIANSTKKQYLGQIDLIIRNFPQWNMGETWTDTTYFDMWDIMGKMNKKSSRVTVIGHIFKLLDIDPSERFSYFKEYRSEIAQIDHAYKSIDTRSITAEEIRRVVDNTDNPRVILMIWYYVTTGARLQSLFNITHIERDPKYTNRAKLVTVEKGGIKTGYRVDQRLADLIPSISEGRNPKLMGGYLSRQCKKTGVKLSAHRIRHFFGKELSNDMDYQGVSMVMNHKSVKTTMDYYIKDAGDDVFEKSRNRILGIHVDNSNSLIYNDEYFHCSYLNLVSPREYTHTISDDEGD